MKIIISARIIMKIMLAVIFFLIIASTAGQLIKYITGHNRFFGLIPLFYLDLEANIPTWYASVALLACSAILSIIAIKKKRDGDIYKYHWILLSIFFLYLSMDEGGQIHDLSNKLIRDIFHNDFFFTGWIYIGIPITIIFAISYYRFIIDLPVKIGRLFVLSGILFVGGSIGIEIIGGWILNTFGPDNLAYVIAATVEESFEMLGVAIFIYSLLAYISSYDEEIVILVKR